MDGEENSTFLNDSNHPSIHLSTNHSLFYWLCDGGKEDNIIGGKLPRSPWPKAGWGLRVCVCSEGVRGEGSILAGHLGLGSQQHSLLCSSASISLSLLLASSRGFPLFPRAVPSKLTFSLPNDPGFGHLLLLSVSSQGLWYSIHVPCLWLSPSLSPDIQSQLNIFCVILRRTRLHTSTVIQEHL